MNRQVQIADLSPYPTQPGTEGVYHAMIKGTGSVSNLDCTYCHYLHKQDSPASLVKSQIICRISEAHIKRCID